MQTTHSTTIAQLYALLAAHQALDGHEKIVRDAQGERAVTTPYTLGGLTRLALAQNISAIEGVVRGFEKVRKDLIRQHAGETGSFDETDEGRAALARCNREVATILEQEREVSLARIKSEDLRLDQNPIPGTVLSGLMPILQAADLVSTQS